MRVVDVAVIGAGSAGLQAFKAARLHTDDVVLIEGGAYGTTCARSGCMPSKLLIAAAAHAHSARAAGAFGVETGEVSVDGRAVMARLHRLRDKFVGGIVEGTEAIPDAMRLRGHARFREPGVLEVDGEPLGARRVVIATGSVPRVPDQIEEGAGPRCLTIADVWERDDLPGSLVVFGAGVIGVESAQAMARLGVRVRCVSKGGGLATLTDEALTAAGADMLRADFPLSLDAEIEEITHDEDGVEVTFTEGGERIAERFDYALAATGRVPNVRGLGLENAGLRLDENGVPIADRATCLCEAGEGPDLPVFVAGDAEGNEPVLPVASDDGRIAGDNAGRWPNIQAHTRKTSLQVTYTHPGIGLAGQSRAEIEAAGIPYRTGEASYADQGRAVVEGRAMGLLRVYGEWGTGRLLGAEMIAPDGEHLAHLLAWAIGRDSHVEEALHLPVYHPCTEEGVRTALRDLARNLKMDALPVERIMATD